MQENKKGCQGKVRKGDCVELSYKRGGVKMTEIEVGDLVEYFGSNRFPSCPKWNGSVGIVTELHETIPEQVHIQWVFPVGRVASTSVIKKDAGFFRKNLRLLAKGVAK